MPLPLTEAEQAAVATIQAALRARLVTARSSIATPAPSAAAAASPGPDAGPDAAEIAPAVAQTSSRDRFRRKIPSHQKAADQEEARLAFLAMMEKTRL